LKIDLVAVGVPHGGVVFHNHLSDKFVFSTLSYSNPHTQLSHITRVQGENLVSSARQRTR
jgi:hypothetical protein